MNEVSIFSGYLPPCPYQAGIKGENMVKVSFYDPAYEPSERLVYSVITARFEGKWVFVRHNLRSTFEIPGGHIEAGESAFEAACRELTEETGASTFEMHCVSTYSVTAGNVTTYGRLFFAEILDMGEVSDKSEIGEVIFLEDLPSVVTYQEIQPLLFERVIRYIQEKLS